MRRAVLSASILLAAAAAGGCGSQAHYRLPSGSMEPTIPHGTRITVDRSAYASAAPRIGDIVLMHPPMPYDQGCPAQGEGDLEGGGRPCGQPWGEVTTGELFVKRVVAGPGDRIALLAGRTLRNGRFAAEPFVRRCTSPICTYPLPVVVPAGTYYMLGDNRAESDDSRFWGPVPRRAILGRVAGGSMTKDG